MRLSLAAAVVWIAVMTSPAIGAAADTCAGAITRSNVAACALMASPALAEELASQRATSGRLEAARPFLPTNPIVSGSIASRRSDTARDTNWSISLGQQLEVGGQRGLRLDVAEHELRASGHRVTATRLHIASEAWLDYFAVLATRERLLLAQRLETATQGVATTVRAMTANGVTSEVDADIADAAALRVTQDRLSLEGTLAADKARLAVLTGAVTAEVEGGLEPLRVEVPRTVATRPEVLALAAEREALERRAALLARERLPNPTVSVTAQDDGFNERVLGVGVSIPIPLPQPVGRTNAGEIAEAAARAERTAATRDRTERENAAELSAAIADYDVAGKARALYGAERVTRALNRLESIASQVKAGRLAVRDGLIAQQALVEQLKSEIDARHWLCAASVRLSRAAGISLEGDAL